MMVERRPTTSVTVLIVTFNGRPYIDECLASVLASDDGPLDRRVLVVDNASTDGTAEIVRERFPAVECVELAENLGFAGGNNAGWEHIARTHPEVQYLCLLNQDTVVADGWLGELIGHLERHPQAACAQAKLRLHPATDRINTAGNVSHFLGFGFTTGYGDVDTGQYDVSHAIDFPSGAACVVRMSVLHELGLFEPHFFAYLEDADLGWKTRLAGWTVDYVPQSVVFHKYEFKSDFRNYYYLERNRWWLLLAYYRLPTLLLLAPALALMEVGQWYFAWSKGRFRDKIRSYAYFLRADHRRTLRDCRVRRQRQRRVSDRSFLGSYVGTVLFSEVRSPLVRWVANPILVGYWAVVRRLMFW